MSEKLSSGDKGVDAGSSEDWAALFEPSPSEQNAEQKAFYEKPYQELSAERADAIFERADLAEDLRFSSSPHTSLEEIAENGLTPRYVVEMRDGVNIGLSEPYRTDNDRPFIVGYVDDGETVQVRSFYRSNSQGIWRLLPGYDGSSGWFNKTELGEDAINLPIKLQQTLSQLTSPDTPIKDCGSSGRNIALGIAGDINDDLNYRDRENPSGRPGNFYHEVHRGLPLSDRVRYYSDLARYPEPSEVIPINPALGADFGAPLGSWENSTDTQGDFTTTIYPSKDGSLHYAFNQDQEGRVWISQVEATYSKTTSFGVNADCVSPGALATPLWEYNHSGLDGGLGDEKNPAHYYYSCMWNNYLSKIPMIQEFIATQQPELATKLDLLPVVSEHLGHIQHYIEDTYGDVPSERTEKYLTDINNAMTDWQGLSQDRKQGVLREAGTLSKEDGHSLYYMFVELIRLGLI